MIKITKKKRYENPLMKKKHELNRLFGGSQKMNIMLYLHLELNRFYDVRRKI